MVLVEVYYVGDGAHSEKKTVDSGEALTIFCLTCIPSKVVKSESLATFSMIRIHRSSKTFFFVCTCYRLHVHLVRI